MNFEKIKKYIIPNTILDIGASVGDFCKEMKEFFPNSYIFSIEANIECEDKLSKVNPNYLIALLYKENTILNFYKTKLDSTSTGNSIYKEISDFFSDENLIVEQITAIKLDDVFTKDSIFELIKLDTQGSEIDIIKGGMELCKRSKYILIEVSNKIYNQNAPLSEEVINFMKENDFEVIEIIDEHIINNELYQQDILFKNINKNINENKNRK